MRRIHYWASIFRRSYWRLIAAVFGLGGAITLARDELGLPSEWREALRVHWLPPLPWYWWAIGVLGTLLLAMMEGAYRAHRDQERRLQQAEKDTVPEEVDAVWALHYLLNESVWAWREIRTVNHWSVVETTRLSEFERVARDVGIRARGFPSSGGSEPERIDQTHWIGARINSTTADTAHGVATKSISRPEYGRKTYGGIRVSKLDVVNAWPRASLLRRTLTGTYVRLKLTWYQIEFEYKRWRLSNNKKWT